MSEESLLNLVNLTTGKLNSNASSSTGKYPFFTCSPETSKIDEYAFNTKALILAGNNAEGNFSLKYYEGKFNAYQRTYILTLENESVTTYRYLYYFLKTKLLELKNNSAGSATRFLTLSILRDINVQLPVLTEQKAIASVLSSLDDKIDLLHRQNKTLESMAETLFRQWFVEDNTGCQVNIDQIIDFNPKRVLKKSDEAIYLDMAGVSTQYFFATGYYKRSFSSGTKFMNQDTLLARITPCLENGKVAYVHFLDEKETAWGSTEFIVMRPKKEMHPLMAYALCRNSDFKEYAESCMEGSTGRQRVNLDYLRRFTVNLPCEKTLNNINENLKFFEAKLVNNAVKICILEKLRDTLLPKLMSGEVRVQYTKE